MSNYNDYYAKGSDVQTNTQNKYCRADANIPLNKKCIIAYLLKKFIMPKGATCGHIKKNYNRPEMMYCAMLNVLE